MKSRQKGRVRTGAASGGGVGCRVKKARLTSAAANS